MDIVKHFQTFVSVKKRLKFLTRFLMSGLIKTHLLRTEKILKRIIYYNFTLNINYNNLNALKYGK